MDVTLGLVTEWLLCASSQLGRNYFHLPVAGSGPEEAEYRERVYCYELYHRWRCHWVEGFPYSLCGEVDKKGHPLIGGAFKPDFLVHVPGEMDNLLIVEVKANDGNWAGMVKDLKKLTKFRRDLRDQNGNSANYRGAYFWVYGVTVAEWPPFRNRLLQEVAESSEFDHLLVSCFIHERAGTRAVSASWT
jgi:hypothetical protein